MQLAPKYGKAVQRNRIKRILRENYKNLEDKLEKGYDIVLLVKKDCNSEQLSFKNIEKDMFNIFSTTKLIVVGK